MMLAGLLAQIIFLDDVAQSIRPEIAAIEQAGFTPKVLSAPLPLANYLSNPHPPIAAIVLDMHIKGIKTLETIGEPNKQTLDGRVAGLAVAEALLRKKGSPYSDIPIAFLTGRPVPPEAEPRIRQLRQNPNDALLIQKDVGLSQFKGFLNGLKAAKDAQDAAREWEDYGEWVRIAGRIAADLFDNPGDEVKLFGFAPKADAKPEQIQAMMQKYPNLEFLNRATLIVDLKTQLNAIYGGNLEAQRKWLNRPLDVLGGKSPRQLLCRTGSQLDLLNVAGLLHRVNG